MHSSSFSHKPRSRDSNAIGGRFELYEILTNSEINFFKIPPIYFCSRNLFFSSYLLLFHLLLSVVSFLISCYFFSYFLSCHLLFSAVSFLIFYCFVPRVPLLLFLFPVVSFLSFGCFFPRFQSFLSLLSVVHLLVNSLRRICTITARLIRRHPVGREAPYEPPKRLLLGAYRASRILLA